MLVVNLFGAPGAGKSSGAAYIFSKLKMVGVNAELVSEYAKDKVWEQNVEVFKNQLYIAGKQSLRLSRLDGKVDVAVTDSPLLLSLLYRDSKLCPEYDGLLYKIFNSYNNINIFVERDKPYSPKGRMQTEEESDKLSLETKAILEKYGFDYWTIKGNETEYDNMVTNILIPMFKKEIK